MTDPQAMFGIPGSLPFVHLKVRGTPQPQGSSRAFVLRGRAVVTSDNPRLAEWRQLVRDATQQALPATFVTEAGPVVVGLVFALLRPASAPKRVLLPAKRPDLDKLARAVLDALTGVVWRDDAQVVLLLAAKVFATETPGLRIDVWRWS